MQNTPEIVVETRSLTKTYGKVVAVDNLSLSIPRGGVFGLLGPNGSGKTTTMSMLLGLTKPTSGSMRLFGQDTASTNAELRRIGAIVETPSFYPYLSGRANLRYFQGIGSKGDPGEVDKLLEIVDLKAWANSKFATYSLGMKQRLGIAYALLGNPDLVFLDEPTNGLDPAGMAEVRNLVKSLGTGGRTVLLSSHLLNEVEMVCDSVAILSRGKLIAQGDVKELVRRQGAVRLHSTNDGRASAILSALPWVTGIRAEGGLLEVSAPAERAWELTAALAAQRIYISEMAPVRVSLEQYFLEVTGEPAAEAAAPKEAK